MKRYQVTAPESSEQGTTPTCDSIRKNRFVEQTLLSLVESAADEARKTAPTTNGREIQVSISTLNSVVCHPVSIPALSLAPFLHGLGVDCVDAGIADPQIWLHRRTLKGEESPDEIDGGILDVDVKLDDPVGQCIQMGVTLPNLIWDTVRGHKLAYVFEQPASKGTFGRVMRRLGLSLPGVDPRSWDPRQGQRLPTSLKSTPAGIVECRAEPLMVNGALLPESAAHGLPYRLATLLGAAESVSPAMRARVEAFLADLQMPAPDSQGAVLYACCPARSQHSAPKCYVNRTGDGTIFVYCLGGHDGEGPKRWTEVDLFKLANDGALHGDD